MKVYILGPNEGSDDEYGDAARNLQEQGHSIYVMPPYVDLRIEIALLTTCDAVCILQEAWTSYEARVLQTIAAWMHLKVVDTQGMPVTTLGLRG